LHGDLFSSKHVVVRTKLTHRAGSRVFVENSSEKLIDNISSSSLVLLHSVVFEALSSGVIGSRSVLSFEASNIFQFADLFLHSSELFFVIVDLLVFLVDSISEFEEHFVLLVDPVLKSGVLSLDSVEEASMFLQKLSLVFTLDDRGIDFSFEHHQLTLVLTALLVHFDEDLALADDVIVDNDFLVHFLSHIHKLVLCVLYSLGELFVSHVGSIHALKFLLELMAFLDNGVV